MESALAMLSIVPEVCCCRFHALSYTDRICQNSLTPGYHFHDLWKDDRRYMENLVKIMNGVGELCHEFSEQMAPYTEA